MKPLKGFCLIEPDTEADRILVESASKIFVPEILRRRSVRSGVVVEAVFPDDDAVVPMFQRGRRVAATGRQLADMIGGRDITGKRVLFNTGQLFHYSGKTLCSVRISDILAFSDAGVTIGEEEVARCPRCKSAGELNIILDGAGYCPVCHLNAAGERREDQQVRLSGDDIHIFGRTAEEYRREQMGDRRPKDRHDRVIFN